MDFINFSHHTQLEININSNKDIMKLIFWFIQVKLVVLLVEVDTKSKSWERWGVYGINKYKQECSNDFVY